MAASMQTASSSDLGAYIDRDLVVPGAADGPLKGLSFAAKDLFDVAGHRTGFGHPLWRETHPPATAHAAAVQALLDAGATLRGKTHMDELAYSLNGENFHYGTPRNPAAPGRIPGGSSSGSAAACAAGDVDVGLGSDTGGSVRIPASYCGLFGIRPTHGRIPTRGALPLAPSFCTVGCFTRDAALLRRACSALLDPSTRGPPPLSRWLVARDAFALAEPGTKAALQDLLGSRAEALAAAIGAGGAGPQEVDVAGAPLGLDLAVLPTWFDVFRVCQAAEIWQCHGAWIQQHSPAFGPGTKERFEMASRITEEEAAAARGKRARVRAHLDALLGTDGVLMMPTAPGPAPLCNTPGPQLDDWRRRMISCLGIAGLAGLPQVSIPAARVDGLPVGLSLVGPRGSDEALLELAERIAPVLGL